MMGQDIIVTFCGCVRQRGRLSISLCMLTHEIILWEIHSEEAEGGGQPI